MGFMAGFASAIEDGYNQRKEAERQQKLLETKEGLGDLKSILEDRSKQEKEDLKQLKQIKATLRYGNQDPEDSGLIMIAKEQFDMGRTAEDIAKDFRMGKLSYGDSPRVSGDTGIQTESAFRTNLAKSESSGDNSAIRMNKDGKMFGGRMMFGQDRLNDYREATGVDLTVEGLSLLDETEIAMLEDWHFNDIKNFITENKLDAKIGEKINGVEITETGMLAVAHLGGKEGLKKFIESNGEYNPSDELGTALGDYASKFSKLDDKPVASAATVAAKPRELTAQEQSALDRAFGDDQKKKDEYAKLLTGYQDPFTKYGDTPKYTVISSMEDIDPTWMVTPDGKLLNFDISTRKGRAEYKKAKADGAIPTKQPSTETVLKHFGFGPSAKADFKTFYNQESGVYHTYDLSRPDELAKVREGTQSGILVPKEVPSDFGAQSFTVDLGKIDTVHKAEAAMEKAKYDVSRGVEVPPKYLTHLGTLLNTLRESSKGKNSKGVDLYWLKNLKTGELSFYDVNRPADNKEYYAALEDLQGYVETAKVPTKDPYGESSSYEWSGTKASLDALVAKAQNDPSQAAKDFLAREKDLRALLKKDNFTEAVKVVQNPDKHTADQVEEAQRLITAETTATQIRERAKNQGAGTGPKVARVVNGVLSMDPNVKTEVKIGKNGIQTKYVDLQGNPVEGEYRVVPQDAVDSMEKTSTALSSTFTRYQGRVAATKKAVRLGGEILELTTKNPAAKTTIAKGLAKLKDLGQNATTFVNVAQQMLAKSKTGEISLQAYEKELQNRGLLAEGQDLNSYVTFNFGGNLDDIANDASRLQAKLLLMGFRVGGLEGQTGNALSNQDFKRLYTVINSSAATFEGNLVSYIQGHIDAAKDARDEILNSTIYQGHITRHTVQPFDMDKVTTDFENLRVWNNDDPRLSQGLLYTIGVKVDDTLLNAIKVPDKVLPVLQANKGRFVKIVMDETKQKAKFKFLKEK